MDGLIESWLDGERNRTREIFQRLLEEGRQVWTPANIFYRCCVKWLVDGPVRNNPYAGFEDDMYSYGPRSGCNGCQRDHPTISLSFDVITTTVTATLSHALDPFVRYFEGLVEEGKAIKLDDLKSYQINGYLRPVETLLYSHDGFKSHLFTIAQGSREESDNAQSTELDMMEIDLDRATKRPRLGTITATPIPIDLIEKALSILFNNKYLENDYVTLYCMRPVCKAFKNIAMTAASERMKTVNLSVRPLVNGMMHYGEGWMDGYDSETCRTSSDNFGEMTSIHYEKKEKVSFAFQEGEQENGLYPITRESATFSWNSGELIHDIYESDDNNHDYADRAEYAYEGNMLRVYWHPDKEDPVDVPKRKSMYGEGKPSLGIHVATFNLPWKPNLGIVSKSKRGVEMKYEILESTTTKTQEEIDDEYSEEDEEESEEDEEESSGNRRQYIRYSGKAKLLKVKVDFGILVRAHASKIKEELYQQHINILKERPLTQTEKKYHELILNAALLK